MLHLHALSWLISLFIFSHNVACLPSYPSPLSMPSSPLFIKGSSTLPRGWSLDTQKPASSNEFITLHIALVQADPSGLEQTLLRVSDPSSHSYGKYLSREAVLGFLAPTNKTVSAVNSWLSYHGIRTSTTPSPEFSISPTHDWYTVNITVSHADRLLSTTFQAYRNSDTGERIIRALSYSLPESLRTAIDVIQPTTIFRASSTRRNAARVMFDDMYKARPPLTPSQFPNCTNSMASVVPPWCAQKLYSVGKYTPLPPTALKGNMIGMCVCPRALFQNATASDHNNAAQSGVPQQLCSTLGSASVSRVVQSQGGCCEVRFLDC